jgi:hypothetical protein
VIQKQLTDRPALALLQGEIREEDSVRIDAAEGELALEKAGAEAAAAACDSGTRASHSHKAARDGRMPHVSFRTGSVPIR